MIFSRRHHHKRTKLKCTCQLTISAFKSTFKSTHIFSTRHLRTTFYDSTRLQPTTSTSSNIAFLSNSFVKRFFFFYTLHLASITIPALSAFPAQNLWGTLQKRFRIYSSSQWDESSWANFCNKMWAGPKCRCMKHAFKIECTAVVVYASEIRWWYDRVLLMNDIIRKLGKKWVSYSAVVACSNWSLINF